MAVFFWHHDLDPDFPLSVLEHETRGGQDRMHWHDYLEIALCLEGRGRFLFGRRAYPIETGDIFLVDNAEPHVGIGEPTGSLRLLLVLFRPELITAPGCRTFDAQYLSPFWHPGRPSANRIPHTTPLATELAPILVELRTIWDRRRRADRHLLDANLRRALGVLISHGRPAAAAPAWPVDGLAPEQLRPVLEYVRRHFRERITLERVSAFVHVSPSRVRHLFKDATSLGFKEYVTSLRLAEARRLLLSTDVNVSDIARSVGYTNIHQFYTVFRRYSSMSPADYRRYYTRSGDDELLAVQAEASGTAGPLRAAG